MKCIFTEEEETAVWTPSSCQRADLLVLLAGGHLVYDYIIYVQRCMSRLVRTQTRLRPGAVRHLSRRQRMTLVSLALVDFMSFCSMSIMAPFFPREASLKGLSDTVCGLVFSFYAIVMFITSPLFGKFVSNFAFY